MKYTRENLENLSKNSNTWIELEDKLGIKRGNSRNFLKNKIKLFGISIEHFSSIKTPIKLKNEDLFVENSRTARNVVKARVLKDKLIPYICECCGQDKHWQNKIMPLILDHINGINNDHRLENLRFLCSNCDSIQDTYKSKNKIKTTQNKTIYSNFKIDFWKEKILENNIDFSKKTWGIEVSKIIDKTPQYALKFVKKYLNELIIGPMPE